MANMAMEDCRWLTVVSPDGIEGIELALESISFPPALVYQRARFDAGIPAIAFITKDIHAEYDCLKKLGVIFHDEPKNMGLSSTGVVDVVKFAIVVVFRETACR